jgi:Uma2 family endonuclease
MLLTKTTLGPRHHGRKMSLRTFENARVEEGFHYELARGYVVVSEVPNPPHARMVALIRAHLGRYQLDNPQALYDVYGGMECKILIPEWKSERHPDLSIYLTAPKGPKNRTAWRRWIPELVIEVVSESSRDRDYTQKRDEYWTRGVKEYWIVDAKLEQVLVLRRGRSDWTETTLGPKDSCETKLLPGFKLPCATILVAGAGDE